MSCAAAAPPAPPLAATAPPSPALPAAARRAAVLRSHVRRRPSSAADAAADPRADGALDALDAAAGSQLLPPAPLAPGGALHRSARAAAGAGLLIAGAAGLRKWWQRRQRDLRQKKESEWVLENHHVCVTRIFEHYDWMQTFEQLSDEERAELMAQDGIRRHDLVALHPCRALEDTFIAVEQWLLLVPEDEERLCGPFTSVHAPLSSARGELCPEQLGPQLDEYIGLSTSRLRIWRTMHFLKQGHDFNGTMQSIVAAAAIQHRDEEDAAAQQLTNCTDIVELRYTRCLMMAVALLRALGVDPGGAATLSLGCGAGTIPMLLKGKYPGMQCDVVDIEPTVIDCARQWMGYEDERLGISTFICDAKQFLEDPAHASSRYDIVFVDAYENSEVPDHLGGTDSKLRAYVQLIKAHIKDTGIVASDLIFYSEEEFDKGLRVWVELFGDQHVHVIAAGENQAVVLAVQSRRAGGRIDVGARQLKAAAAAVCSEGKYLFDLSQLVPECYRRVPEDPDAPTHTARADGEDCISGSVE